MTSSPHTYRFADWHAEPQLNLLRRGDETVRLKPRTMDGLAYLLEHPGRVVSKDELLREVWRGQAVTDDALVVTIYELRKSLGDRARQPTYIETVSGRGYRFLPTVTLVESREAVESEPVRETPPPLRRWRWAWAACAVVILSVVALGVLQARPATDDPEMLTALETARGELALRTAASLTRAELAYRHLGDDPRALAGLARVATLRADLRLGDRFALYHQARGLAERALAIDPTVVDAHLALGAIHLLIDWDVEAARLSLDRALALAPDDPDVLQVQAWQLSALGRHDAAIDAARRAVEGASSSITHRADLAFLQIVADRPDKALETIAATSLDDPELTRLAAIAHLAQGDEASAGELLHRWAGSPASLPADYWAIIGAVAERLADDHALVMRAALHAREGELDTAMRLLERAYERRDWEILWLERLPGFAPLHAHEGFAALIERRRQVQLS
ncbi:MAG: winged helix-turn-helix domain-containing protein [Acidobacteriota bacterium]